MIRKAFLLSAGAAMVAGFLLSHPSVTSAGANKVKVCHVPPGNPDNFHTITISDNGTAVETNMADGDWPGSCDENCEELCNDGDLCTQDNCTEDGCDFTQPVNCDDSNVCTENSCDSATGCIYPPEVGDIDCDDGNACTGPDKCDAGTCGGMVIAGCCYDDTWCEDGDLCTDDSCEIEPGNLAGECSNTGPPCTNEPCSAGYCDPNDGACKQMYLCDPDEQCNEDTNSCEPMGEVAYCNTPGCGTRLNVGLVLDGEDWQGTADPFAGPTQYNDVADACAIELIAQGCSASYSDLFAACLDEISSEAACVSCLRPSMYGGDCTSCRECTNRLYLAFVRYPISCEAPLVIDECVEP